MIQSMRKFIYNMVIITVILLVVGYILLLLLFPQYYFPYFPVIPAFLFLVTILGHSYLIRASERSPEIYIQIPRGNGPEDVPVPDIPAGVFIP